MQPKAGGEYALHWVSGVRGTAPTQGMIAMVWRIECGTRLSGWTTSMLEVGPWNEPISW